MSTPSSWDLINKIDQSISAPHFWTQKLEAIAEAILSSDNYDLVWLLTLPPLPAASAGALQTHPASTPTDTISLSDTSPPISEDWPPKHSVLAHVLRTGLPLFGAHIGDDTNDLLCDFGNLLRSHTKINIQAVIPLKADDVDFGILIVGNHQNKAILATSQQELLKHIARHLVLTLHNRQLQEETKNKTRLLDAVQERTLALKDIDMLGEKLLTRSAPEGMLETILDTLPQILPADVHGVIINLPGFAKMGLKLPGNATQTMVAEIQQTMLDALNHKQSPSKKLRLEDPHIVYGDKLIPDDWQPQSQLTLPVLTLSDSLGALHLAYGRQSAVSADMIHLFSLVVSRISGILENTRLITEIEQERARLAAILSSTADGILVVDRSDHIILDNPAACTILERTHSQIGKNLGEAIDNQDLLNLVQTAKASGGAAGEFSYTGEKIYYARISPVYAGQDTIIGWVAVMQDVSTFKKLNEAKDSFVSDVSHDLRSPLSSIALASHLLKLTGSTNDQQEELLDTINKNIERMTGLIEDLLDAGKIEADIGMEMEDHLVNPLIFEAAAQLATQADQKRINYQIDLSDHLYTIHCNPRRLQQVVANLTSNAIKYTPENGVVAVRLFSKDSNLLFQVTDTGYGIPQKDQARIFDKFYRVKGEYMIGKEGSGLGLSITKSIIEKHSGKIWVESAPGKGSAFTIMLPLIRVEKDAAKV